MNTRGTTPSAVTFAKLLGDGPMARVALQASLDELAGPAFIVSATGTVLHSNADGHKRVAKSADGLRSQLSLAVRSLADETAASHALVTPLRCDGGPSYFLVIFRPPSTVEESVETAAALWELTPRQKDTLALLVEGFGNKTIAVRLHCAERTIESHLTEIFKKSGYEGRTALLAAIAAKKL